jgi:hypothetical protein
MAQIINKKSEIIIASVRAKGFAFISVKEKGLHFTKQTALLCGMKAGKFVHFINDSNYWAFYVNEDPDGFTISADHTNGGYVLYSRQLARLFRSTVGGNNNNRYFVDKTKALHNDHTVYEILTSATMETIIDKRKRMDDQKKLEKKYVLNLTLKRKTVPHAKNRINRTKEKIHHKKQAQNAQQNDR